MLLPGKKTPKLRLPTVEHGDFDLKACEAPNGTFLFFYRGGHSALCVRQMKEAEAQFRSFQENGLDAVFVSADDGFKARNTVINAGLRSLKVAHSLSLVAARDEWRLAISEARAGSSDPDFFNEPAIFFVLPDRRLHSFWLQSQSHARPRIEHLTAAAKLAVKDGKPVRGGYSGRLPEEG